MKKNLLLVPIALTALTPTISMVGCSDPDTPVPPGPTPPAPEDCIKLDRFYDFYGNYGCSIRSNFYYPEEGATYKFLINMNDGKSTKPVSSYTEIDLGITSYSDCLVTKDDLLVFADNDCLDTSSGTIRHSTSTQSYIKIDPKDFEKLLNAKVISGQIKVSDMVVSIEVGYIFFDAFYE